MPRLAFLFLLLHIVFPAFSQPYSIYQNVTTSNGLPSNYVFAVCEDENGFLWIGTDKGLCRYDGFNWKIWDKDNGLPGNYVNKVYSDKKGGLWLGISDKGFFHFDTRKGTVKNLSLPGTAVNNVLVQQDGEGDMYSEILNNKTGFIEGYIFHSANPAKPELIYRMKDKAPVKLVADVVRKRILCFSPNLNRGQNIGKIVQTRWPVITVHIPADAYNSTIYYAADSIIITNKDYIKLSGTTSTRHQYSDASITLGSILFSSDSVLITNTDFIKFSKEGRILFKHALFKPGNNYAYNLVTKTGFYVYDIKTGYYFISHKGEKKFYGRTSGLGTDYVNHIYQTKDGTLIFSTLGAGLQFIKNAYQKTFFTDNKLVRSILSAGRSWYILAGDKILKTRNDDQQFLDLGKAGNSSLHLYKTGDTLLVGSLRGISIFKENESQLKPLKFLEFTAGISSIIKSGARFISGTYGGGLIRFTANNIDTGKKDYAFRIIEKLVPLPEGFGALSYEDGVLLANTAKRSTIHLTQLNGLISNSVYSLYPNNDTLWIGTKGGLNVYTGGKVVKTLRFRDGFEGNKSLYCFHDAQKQLWVVSDQNLCQVNGNLLNPVASYPLVSDDDVITSVAYNKKSNELAIGSNKAFSIIAMDAIHPQTVVAAPEIIEALLDGTTLQDSTFTVPYQFKKLQFTIAPLSASPFSQSRFYYRLEGREDVWNEVKDSLAISFSALRPGNYQLLTKTINADGYESNVVKLASFTVQKPIWQRWPFLALCIIATALLTTLLVRRIESAKRRKKESEIFLQQSLQNERERISKDLHDHLGTNLATIIAQTDNIEARLYKGEVDKASATVQHLSTQTREAMDVLRETIWAVQESEHNLNDFIIRIRTFLQRMFESTLVQWQVKSTAENEIILSPTQTLHLFRIIQEASQNIVKHSRANQSLYHFSIVATGLQILISDNGQGFSHEEIKYTNGLINMRERVEVLQGSFTIDGTKGTAIKIILPV